MGYKLLKIPVFFVISVLIIGPLFGIVNWDKIPKAKALGPSTLPLAGLPDLESMKPTEVPNIIFMNDFAADHDGAIGLLMLAYLQNMGYANIKAAVGDTSYVEAGWLIDSILSSYGIDDVPIGVFNLASATTGDARNGYKNEQINTNTTLLSNNSQDSTVVLRQTLADATEPITLLTNGPLFSLDALMDSPENYNGDGLPDGITLIRDHVNKLLCGGGYYYKSSSLSNFNMNSDMAGVASSAITTWNTSLSSIPIIFIGEDASDAQPNNIYQTDFFQAEIQVGINNWQPNNPAYWMWGCVPDKITNEGLECTDWDLGGIQFDYGDDGFFYGGYGSGYTESHDLIRTFYAVFGDNNSDFFTLSDPGVNTVIPSEGDNDDFDFASDGNSRYLIGPLDPTTLNDLVGRIAYTAAHEDITPPETTATVNPASPNGSAVWYKTAPTISLSATDSGDLSLGVNKIYYKWEYANSYSVYTPGVTTINVPQGSHTLSYYSEDIGGNKELVNTREIKLDSDSPSISFTNPPTVNETTTSSTYTIRGTMADYLSGIDWVKINGVSLPVDSEDFAVNVSLMPGKNTFTITSADKVGNTGTTYTIITRTEVPIAPSIGDPSSIRDVVPRTFQTLSENLSTPTTINSVEATDTTENIDSSESTTEQSVETPIDTFSIYDGSDYQPLNLDQNTTTYTERPTFKGRTYPNSKVILEIHSSEVITGETTSDAEGNWSYQVDKALSTGAHTLKITVKDKLDKVLSENSYNFTVEKKAAEPGNRDWIYYSAGGLLLLVVAFGLLKAKGRLA